jgi:hypothetical protein
MFWGDKMKITISGDYALFQQFRKYCLEKKITMSSALRGALLEKIANETGFTKTIKQKRR